MSKSKAEPAIRKNKKRTTFYIVGACPDIKESGELEYPPQKQNVLKAPSFEEMVKSPEEGMDIMYDEEMKPSRAQVVRVVKSTKGQRKIPEKRQEEKKNLTGDGQEK